MGSTNLSTSWEHQFVITKMPWITSLCLWLNRSIHLKYEPHTLPFPTLCLLLHPESGAWLLCRHCWNHQTQLGRKACTPCFRISVRVLVWSRPRDWAELYNPSLLLQSLPQALDLILEDGKENSDIKWHYSSKCCHLSLSYNKLTMC